MSYGGDIENAGDDSWHMMQINGLERRLTVALSIPDDNPQEGFDQYCEWLESQGIKTDNGRGWPSPAVYDETNVSTFIRLHGPATEFRPTADRRDWNPREGETPAQARDRIVASGERQRVALYKQQANHILQSRWGIFDCALHRAQRDSMAHAVLALCDMVGEDLPVAFVELERTKREVVFRIRPNPDPEICNVYLEYGDDPLRGGVHSSMAEAIQRAYRELKR